MYNTGVYPTHVLHVKNMCITHVSATHRIHLYSYTCNTSKNTTCITGIAQLVMYWSVIRKFGRFHLAPTNTFRASIYMKNNIWIWPEDSPSIHTHVQPPSPPTHTSSPSTDTCYPDTHTHTHTHKHTSSTCHCLILQYGLWNRSAINSQIMDSDNMRYSKDYTVVTHISHIFTPKSEVSQICHLVVISYVPISTH